MTSEELSKLALDDVAHRIQPQTEPTEQNPNPAPVPCQLFVVTRKAGVWIIVHCTEPDRTLRLPNPQINDGFHLPADCPITPP